MAEAHVVHLVPAEEAWELHAPERRGVLTFLDLGVALDFVLATSGRGTPVRIVLHENGEQLASAQA